jgi:hypothetical protein
MFASDDQLRGGKLEWAACRLFDRRPGESGMVVADTMQCYVRGGLVCSDEVFGLFPVLLQAGMRGDWLGFHTKLLSKLPGVRTRQAERRLVLLG